MKTGVKGIYVLDLSSSAGYEEQNECDHQFQQHLLASAQRMNDADSRMKM